MNEAMLFDEMRCRHITDNIEDVLWLVTPGEELYVNPAYEKVWGRSRESLYADPNSWVEAVHPDDKAILEAAMKTQYQSGYNIEYRIIRPDGEIRYIHDRAFPIRDEEGKAYRITGIAKDITKRKQAEQQLRQSEERFRLLYQNTPVPTYIWQQIESDFVLIDYNKVAFAFTKGRIADLCGAKSRDVYKDRREIHKDIAACHAEQSTITREMVYRLISTGEQKDFIVTYVPVPPDLVMVHTEDVTERVALLQVQTTLAAENARLVTELQQANADLTRAYDATIEGWARALDLRDKETEGHSRRVTDLTLRLATALGMGEDDLRDVRRGALLHDIGKMGVPDSILLKPGPLTKEERSIMQQHPLYAKQLLAPIEFLRPALDIPLHHHEWWDGSGYPYGLQEGKIPLPARIFSPVDVWDALCSDRPYRLAWPADKVKNYLRELSGVQFDPACVETLLEILA